MSDAPSQDNQPEKVKPKENVSSFDPSKLTDEDLSKVFEDERLYKHKRFDQLRNEAKKAKEYEEEKKKADEERLKAQGEFQKLAEQKDQELQQLREQTKTERLNSRILTEAMGAGAVDPDAVLALVDKSKITYGEDGQISGVKEAVEALLAQKQYLLANKKGASVGSGTNPPNLDTATFTMSQIKDPVFYQANREAIQKASREGRIRNDLR